MSNGCGCEKGVLKFIKPPYARKFYIPCCMHDDDYDEGGDKSDRKEADRMLFFRMMKKSFEDKNKHFMDGIHRISILYSGSIVRAFLFQL